MRAELVRLRAAFPEFSFGICPGWRGPMFEVWRETGTGGLYAVITHDVRELRRELEESQSGPRPVATQPGTKYGKPAGCRSAFALEGVTAWVLKQ